MTNKRYWYTVGTDKQHTVYSGHDVADAMAAWSEAVVMYDEYVTLEALLEDVK